MSTSERALRPSRKQLLVFRVVAVLAGLSFALASGELLLRLQHEATFEWRDLRPAPWGFPADGFFGYDPGLGWVPAANSSHTWRAGWTANTDEHGFRRNGPVDEAREWAGAPLLAVGDSGAFGDEVEDHQSWPAHLERIAERRVLNAGVSAYGVDQAMLRAERLLPDFAPSVVVMSVVSDDVTRAAMSFYYRWKPHFSIDGDELTLHPAQPPEVPLAQPLWLVALGHSHLAEFAMTRLAPMTWERRMRLRAVRDQHELSARVLQRLDATVRAHGGRLLVVLMTGSNRDLTNFPGLLERLRGTDVEILDLSRELDAMAADPVQHEEMFRPHHHLSDAGNAWMAGRIAARLRELGWIDTATEPGR